MPWPWLAARGLGLGLAVHGLGLGFDFASCGLVNITAASYPMPGLVALHLAILVLLYYTMLRFQSYKHNLHRLPPIVTVVVPCKL